MSGHFDDDDTPPKQATPKRPNHPRTLTPEETLRAHGPNALKRQAMGETDPTGRAPNEPGAKLDAGKLLPWLMITGFAHALQEVAVVTTIGARKYTPNGWRTVPNGRERYLEAFSRHAMALARGEEVDADTGCLHLAQMAWNLLAVLELDLAPPLLGGGE